MLDVGNQLLYPFDIGPVDHFGAPETPFPIGRLLCQDVSSESPLDLHLPCPGLLETLCCPTIRLQFWHVISPSFRLATGSVSLKRLGATINHTDHRIFPFLTLFYGAFRL